jgi:GrpB-like predicted nucleotidyltransferase (UPF0157 family)
VVTLRPYSPEWVAAGEAERHRLLSALGRWSSDVEHVGSTAVPGLAAKPIIDICVGVADLAHADEMAGAMVTPGYDYPGDVGIPEDRVFGRSPGWRTHLVHVVVLGGARWNAYIRFRDALRADAALRAEYEAVKQQLALVHHDDRFTYTQRKAAFVERVLTQ